MGGGRDKRKKKHPTPAGWGAEKTQTKVGNTAAADLRGEGDPNAGGDSGPFLAHTVAACSHSVSGV